ncbi:retrieval of early ER protein Rer1 [Obelidium mucronatum]|nr:retrieval of early ER protein Rer1 [Obelidium mucronatum]
MDNSAANGAESPSKVQAQVAALQRRFQATLDQITPYWQQRWIATGVLFFVYVIRVWIISAYYIVTYSLGIYLLNLFLAFLQPKFDPAMEQMEDGADDELALPTKNDDEFRPFIRRLPEFKFWYWGTRGIGTAFICTFIPIFDVPVFWPILVVYFLILFGLTMKQRIKHMIKYKYVPWNFGKKSYSGGGAKNDK